MDILAWIMRFIVKLVVFFVIFVLCVWFFLEIPPLETVEQMGNKMNAIISATTREFTDTLRTNANLSQNLTERVNQQLNQSVQSATETVQETTQEMTE